MIPSTFMVLSHAKISQSHQHPIISYDSYVKYVPYSSTMFHVEIPMMLPSGKHTKIYGTSPFFMDKSGKSIINGHFQ
jgi:hypothetical protein